MKIFAISDLHLSHEVEKPMDVFGGAWENYTDKISDNWQKIVGDEDIVLIAGDISWAMKLEDAQKDIEEIDDDSIHIDEHTRYILCEYESLSKEQKQRLFEHLKQHKLRLANAI